MGWSCADSGRIEPRVLGHERDVRRQRIRRQRRFGTTDAGIPQAPSAPTGLAIVGGTSAGWTHEPTGLTTWFDAPIDALTGNGWGIVNLNGYATVVADVAAPFSPTGVGQWRYPSGFAGGQAPATMYHSLPSAFDEGFVGVWWKPSNPWQGHSTYVKRSISAWRRLRRAHSVVPSLPEVLISCASRPRSWVSWP